VADINSGRTGGRDATATRPLAHEALGNSPDGPSESTVTGKAEENGESEEEAPSAAAIKLYAVFQLGEITTPLTDSPGRVVIDIP
jgi:hypothetical protein